jgi:cytochrome c oxidase subunit II
VGKQWMWKIQHPEGNREINELHVPVGKPVRLTMTTEDVLHSFYVPAFRIKKDVVPGMYTQLWFEATKVGSYHLFCAEYCGNQHSGMIGKVHVMEAADYEAWLAGTTRGESMESAGQRQFEKLGCATCHLEDNSGRGPSLKNIFGKPVQLQNNTTVTVDEAYLRESVLQPQSKIVRTYTNVQMPTFQGQISEDGILQVISYIRSMSATPAAPAAAATPAPATQGGKQ